MAKRILHSIIIFVLYLASAGYYEYHQYINSRCYWYSPGGIFGTAHPYNCGFVDWFFQRLNDGFIPEFSIERGFIYLGIFIFLLLIFYIFKGKSTKELNESENNNQSTSKFSIFGAIGVVLFFIASFWPFKNIFSEQIFIFALPWSYIAFWLGSFWVAMCIGPVINAYLIYKLLAFLENRYKVNKQAIYMQIIIFIYGLIILLPLILSLINLKI